MILRVKDGSVGRKTCPGSTLSTTNPTSIGLESKSGLSGVRRRPIIQDMHGPNVFGMTQRTRGRYFPKSHRPEHLVSVREKVFRL